MSEAVRLDVLVAAMARRGNPVVPESGLFVVLEAVEALHGAPRELRAANISLNADGVVGVAREAPECTEPEAVAAVAALLDEVLVAMPASAIELMSRLRASEIGSLTGLCSELEAMLVPLNRGAARRMLGRLAREHDRGARTQDFVSSRAMDAGDLDIGVGALLASAEPSDASGPQGASDTQRDPPDGADGNASDTVVEGRTLESAERTDQGPVSGPRVTDPRGWLMIALALVALASGALFLYARLR